MALDTPGQLGNTGENSITTSATSVSHALMDLTQCVLDTNVSLSKQLLNAYIYDFLIKNTLPQTSRLFVCEADIPSVPYEQAQHLPSKQSSSATSQANQLSEEHHLPRVALSMDAPQGFLFEWWQVFWDVLQARNEKNPSPVASQYYQMLLMKQRHHQEALGMD